MSCKRLLCLLFVLPSMGLGAIELDEESSRHCPSGPQGPAGPRGVMGPTGPTGATGIGPMGPAGERGPQGAMGAEGPRGSTGPTGARGAMGAMGATGATGLEGTIGKGLDLSSLIFSATHMTSSDHISKPDTTHFLFGNQAMGLQSWKLPTAATAKSLTTVFNIPQDFKANSDSAAVIVHFYTIYSEPQVLGNVALELKCDFTGPGQALAIPQTGSPIAVVQASASSLQQGYNHYLARFDLPAESMFPQDFVLLNVGRTQMADTFGADIFVSSLEFRYEAQ